MLQGQASLSAVNVRGATGENTDESVQKLNIRHHQARMKWDLCVSQDPADEGRWGEWLL